jgi:pimeloyl-ACP methyl ester carboxylesterase
MAGRIIVSLIAGLVFMPSLFAQDTDSTPDPVGYWNLKTKTLGGTQFWTDVIHFHQWRIQLNVVTGHYRLIDENNVRHAWGNFPHCEEKLRSIAIEKNLPPMRGTVVIMLHGLGRTRNSLSTLGEYIHKETGHTIVNMSYASMREGVEMHADALHSVISRMPEVEHIHLVCHSLGNIVVRRYLQKYSDQETGTPGDHRISRMVMLGPPNQGSTLARIAAKTHVFLWVAGKSGRELSEEWEKIDQYLATPQFEFGIIAGTTEESWLKNPVLKDDSDLFVKVEETKLAGAADHQVVPAWHGFMMSDPEVHKCVVRFINNGYLISPESRTPLR